MALDPMMQAPMGPMGPASAPTDNPGAAADALSKVRTAIDMLQQALPALPVGSDPHKDVLDAVQKLSKSVPQSAEIPGVQTTQIAGLQQEAEQGAVLQQLMKAMGGSGGAPVPAVQPAM